MSITSEHLGEANGPLQKLGDVGKYDCQGLVSQLNISLQDGAPKIAKLSYK